MADDIIHGKSKIAGTLCALLAALAFGALIPCTKMLLSATNPLQLATLILLGAGIGTACIVVARAALGAKTNGRPIGKEQMPKLALMMLLNAGAVSCLTCGVVFCFARNASLLMGFETAAATLCAFIFFNRHICVKACVAVGLICVASVLLFWNVGTDIVFVPESLLLVAACTLRGLESGLKRSLADRDSFQIACARSLGGGLVLLAATAITGQMQAIEPTDAVLALLLGLVVFGIGACLHLIAQSSLGSARAESYFSVAPFVGVIVSWSCFGITLEPLFFGALALMALGVWLAMDDSVFHEDAFAALNRERLMLYSGEAASFDFDILHRPL